jgi:hypothetical protein
MQTYTVIWRDDGDDYMFTVVDMGILDPLQMTNLEWVLEAADVEYVEWPEQEQIQAKADLLDGFELLAVVKGELEYVA